MLPVRSETSGHANRKRKEDTSTDEDEEHLAESSHRKKRKKHSVEEPDMFDSDFKGQLSFSKKSSAKPVSTSRPPKSAGADSGKPSKHPDDDSGLGSSLSEPKKSKKSRKLKSTGDPDNLQDELRWRKERQERADRDDRATQALLVKYRPLQYGLEAETMKNYRSQHVTSGRAGCENTDDHSGYIPFVIHNNKQSYICQSFHLLMVDAYFRRLKHKMEQTTNEDRTHLTEVYNESQRTLSKKLTGVKGKTSDSSLAKYLIRVLRSSSGDILDASHLEFGMEQNLGLHGLVNAIATTCITQKEKLLLHNGWGEGYIEHGFCPLCSYASGGHRALSNHIRAHLRLAMFCGWCYYVSVSTDDMLRHGKAHEIK